MIKVETLGMLDIAKINPVLTSANDVTNNSFLTVDGVTYLIMNDINGDDSYKDGVVIKAGEYLNGYDVSVWTGQKLVVDEKHVAYGSGEDYDDLAVEDTANSVDATILTINNNGKLAIASEAPASGVYFVVTDKVTLTEKAVKVKVVVA